MPTTNDSKQIILDQVARLNAGDLAGAVALVAEDCVNHAALPEAQGRDGFARISAKIREAFPDLQRRVEDSMSDGDRAFVRLTVTGTHKGPLAMARVSLAPTGKQVRYEQMLTVRVANGRIVESWMTFDFLAMARQLGLEIKPAS